MQGIETTAVAFPCGQLGVVLPVAISLALFANINLGFAQPQGAPKPSGNNPVFLTQKALSSRKACLACH